MELSLEQLEELKELMRESARKGNLANAAVVLENDKPLAYSESLVVSNHDATAHSERLLVETVCKDKLQNYTAGLIMVTVCQPCLMCLSACSQAGYATVGYIIPAKKYVDKIPWMSDNTNVNMEQIANTMSSPVKLMHLAQYEQEFSQIFEHEMETLLK